MQPRAFDPRQSMQGREFELQYKRDLELSNVDLHHHDFFEVYYLVSGNVTYTVDSRVCRVLPGDLLFIAPSVLHQVNIRSELSAYERYVLWIDPKLVAALSSEHSNLMWMLSPENPGCISQLRLQPRDQQQILSLLETLLSETESAAYGSDLQCRSLITQLLVKANRLAAEEGNYYEAFSSSKLISQVIEHINHHYSEDLSLVTLSEQFFISKYHLSHEFNRQVGTGIHRYIQKKRLQVARELLLQGEKPTSVYALCGFADYAVFFRAFKAEYGYSPRHFLSQIHS